MSMDHALDPGIQADSRHGTGQREMRLHEYFRSDDFICGPGKGAIISNRVPLVPLDFAFESGQPASESDLMPFRRETAIRDGIREYWDKIDRGALDGVIFFEASSDPLSHEHAFAASHEFFVQASGIALELRTGRPASYELIRMETRTSIVRNQSLGRYVMEGVDGALFLSAMGPLFPDFDEQKHPRFTPHFCIAAIHTRPFSNLAAAGSYETTTDSISSNAMSRTAFPYTIDGLYPIPGDWRFALMRREAVEMIYERTRGAGYEVPEFDDFVRACAVHSLKLGLMRTGVTSRSLALLNDSLEAEKIIRRPQI